MKMFAEGRKTSEMREDFHIRGSERPIPPHERKALMHIEFDEEDRMLWKDVFGDEDTAAAAAEIIREAPPEIQILAIQLINFIEEVI